ncbi:MAG: hypothetical protein HOG39_09365, partial [Candidatus Marinimicrobia bacterium]|nr:hypothetical protein [Candidatus Neomarinimicrobiota bacterium]
MIVFKKRLIFSVLFFNIALSQLQDFIGSDICKSCHPDQFELWKESTHGHAGGAPFTSDIKAPFNGQKIDLKDGWFLPFQQDNRYFFLAQENGFPEVKYEVSVIVGSGHLYGGGTQAFFSVFPDGTMRLLPFDYHPEKETWFFETNNLSGWVPASKSLSMRKLAEWPPNRMMGGILEKQNCQQCHGSQIITTFDPNQGKYKTSFTNLSINCESCHGPGQEHVSLMQFDQSIVKGYTGIQSLKTLSKDKSIEVCAQCHALKDMIRPGYLPGKDFDDYFSVKFSMLSGNPYHPDGRVKAFGYQQNHIFSDCYLNGSMTCIDCHNPHSNGYQDINRNPLMGRFDNGQCVSCHVSKKEKISIHTFHKTESEGSRCTACHMPFQQHKAVGNKLKFARADHTIAIPRPILDQQLGIKNACQQCHDDMTIQLLNDQITKWYGELKPLHPLESALFSFQNGNVSDEGFLNLFGSNADPIPQVFAGISAAFMSKEAITISETAVNRLKGLSENKDLDIQALSLAFLDAVKGDDQEIEKFIIHKLSQAGKDQRKIRTRWSLALAYKAEDLIKAGKMEQGMIIYKKSIKIWPNNARARKGLGEAYLKMGNINQSINTFGEIVKSNSLDWRGWAGLGRAQALAGQNALAIEAFIKALEINSHFAEG